MTAFRDLQKQAVSWEVELTTRCNSRCVGCSRYSEYYYDNPYFDPKVDLKKEIFFKALQSTDHIEFVLFCGNYGDPLLHPEIFEILEFIRKERGDLRILVHSNASFGSADFWKKMATYFQAPGSYIKFSIDGLSESHAKFRRGTNWEQVLNNAKIFMAAGGRAVWKMIEFDHNRHEIEEARKLSEEMGFRKFDLRKNNYPGLDQPILEEVDWRKAPASVTQSARTQQELERWSQSEVSAKKFEHIECHSLKKKNIFLDSFGQVWPCCWIGGLPHRPEHELRQWFIQKISDRYGAGFNSLATKNLQEILNHSWFASELEQSWSKSPTSEINPMLSTCAKTCGQCRTKDGAVSP